MSIVSNAERTATRGATSVRGLPRTLLSATRPRQWSKNLLVLAAPAAGGALPRHPVAASALLALLCFVLASAAVYLTNDLADIERDRAHPTKALRPIASGALPVPVAAAAAAACLIAAVTLAATVRVSLAVVVTVYLLISLGYSAGLKRVPGVELLVLASGFVLRPLAGAVATGVAPSRWFLAVCSLGALTVAAGKRYAELRRLGPSTSAAHREALRTYLPTRMRLLRVAAGSLMLAAYALWAATRATPVGRWLDLVSLVPLSLAMLRYQRRNDLGDGEAPEELVLADRPLQFAAGLWLVVFLLGVWRG